MQQLCSTSSNRFRRRAACGCLALLLFAVVACGGVTLADEQLLSRDEAIELVREQTDGRVLGVDTRNNDYFLIRVLIREGNVRVYEVDRRSGAVRG